jgi:hypothetical protein
MPDAALDFKHNSNLMVQSSINLSKWNSVRSHNRSHSHISQGLMAYRNLTFQSTLVLQKTSLHSLLVWIEVSKPKSELLVTNGFGGLTLI